MKKKLAVLLALITSFSTTTVFAETSNNLSKTALAVTNKTLIMEEKWSSGNQYNLKNTNDHSDKIEAVIDGNTLFLKPTVGRVEKGHVVKIQLENAEWFFRHNTTESQIIADMSFDETDAQADYFRGFIKKYGKIKSTDTSVVAAPFKNKITIIDSYAASLGIEVKWFEDLAQPFIDETKLETYDATVNDIEINTLAIADQDDLLGKSAIIKIPLATRDFNNKLTLEKIVALTGTNDGFAKASKEISTYDIRNGFYNDNKSTYYKYNNFPSGNSNKNFAYMMAISSQGAENNVATLTFLEDYDPSDFPSSSVTGIPIPLVSLTKNEGDIRVRIGEGSNSSTVSQNNYKYGEIFAGSTNTSIVTPVFAKFSFLLDRIEIKEVHAGSLVADSVTLTAPYGYSFADPKKPRILANGSTGPLPAAVASENLFFAGNATIKYNEVLSNGKGRYIDYGVGADGKYMQDTVVIDTSASGLGLTSTIKTNGILAVEGLTLIAQDYASYDSDIKLKIKGKGITEQYFTVGKRTEWAILMKALDPIPKLVSGRYEKEDIYNSSEYDKEHKTAKFNFSEKITASLLSGRETIFTLPEGVSFRKVVIENEKNFNYANSSMSILEGTYYPKSDAVNYVYLDANKLKISGLNILKDQISSFDMTCWVSIESGFEGNIDLKLDGNEDLRKTPALTIATAVSPITIKSTVTDVKIGQQWQKTADFVITETAPSMLKRNKQVKIFIDDDIKIDNISFAKEFVIEKNADSELKISKPTAYENSIYFNVENISVKVPATLKFTNVTVKIDRNVPHSNNRPYQVVAGGTAIAENSFEETNTKPSNMNPAFPVKGLGADYLLVITSADAPTTTGTGGLSSSLQEVVRVQIGSKIVKIGKNGETTMEMDTEAYISPQSNSTMVPVRFVAQALGIPTEQVQWDPIKRKVTINYEGKVIQFTIGSSEIIINGIPSTMFSLDTPPKEVFAEVKDDRSFLPLRQLGFAFDIKVGWEEETKTAIFNADKIDTTTKTTTETITSTDAK